MSEFIANQSLESAAMERARWAAVLAPTGRSVRRKPGMLARIAALFA
jgi:hypothetical protein